MFDKSDYENHPDGVAKFYEDVDARAEVLLRDDFDSMAREIAQYCADNGGHVIPLNVPRQLRLGYLHWESGKYWQIRISRVHKSCKRLGEDRKAMIRDALSNDRPVDLCGTLCNQDIGAFIQELKESYLK